MVEEKDYGTFDKIQLETVKKLYDDIEETLEQTKRMNIYCHFAKGVGEPSYRPVPTWEELNKILVEALGSYNEVNAAMSLVLFEDAMCHVCRINRILESPRGNALLVGVGGSGKQSLTRLAAFISSLELFQITLRKGYGIPDLKVVLCFSPVGSKLRVRSRRFPAIISCTAIGWFQEWPQEALESVSLRFLQETETVEDSVKDSISKFMAYVHTSVNEISRLYLSNERRYNYTTPKSFLEQIKLYQNLLLKKGKDLKAKMERLENGLEKLKSTSAQVDELKARLAAQEVELKQKNEDADKLIRVVGVETEKVSREKAIADEEEQKVALITQEVEQKQKDCEEDLAKAEPALEAAQAALNTLNKKNLTELRSFGSPPSAVSNVTAAVMVLMAPGGKIPKDRSWKAAKAAMARVDGFLDSLIKFDKENIHENCLKALQPYLQDPKFKPEFVTTKSLAAAGLCSWVVNMVRFHAVFCEVQPKRQALSRANAELAAAQDKLASIKAKIARLNENLRKLTAKFEKATSDKLKCQQEAEATACTIALANRLEDDQLRVQALKKAVREREEKTQKEMELLRAKKKLEALKKEHQKLSSQVQKHSIFKNYLEDVVKISPQFEDIQDVISRYKLLVRTRKDLQQSQEKDREMMEQAKVLLDQYEAEKAAEILQCQNELEQLQRRFAQAQSDVRFWTARWADMQNRNAKNALMLTTMKMAVHNLFQCVRGYLWQVTPLRPLVGIKPTKPGSQRGAQTHNTEFFTRFVPSVAKPLAGCWNRA
ncbi:dynein axonemal heavy chain 9-like isoform X3 [Patagioenas fasciata]|uniref:dynein axonemal heavy chain 9-like isoform X3 n=1 Tax=Patagioenas fasciata TaxID=372321 RepID=UPI003A99961D